MRTSLNEIQLAEAYLHGKLMGGDKLVFETSMLLNPSIQASVTCQQQVYHIVNAYGRKQLKAEIEAVHSHIFHSGKHLSFRQRILNIFKDR